MLLLSTLIFCALAPVAKRPLAPLPAFIPIYEAAVVITDLITAVLLFGQYRVLRSPAVAVLGSGYLFTAFMTAGHALSFPGLFSPAGLMGSGPQTTVWIYMLWHGGFPLFVLVYAALMHMPPAAGRQRAMATAARSSEAVGVRQRQVCPPPRVPCTISSSLLSSSLCSLGLV